MNHFSKTISIIFLAFLLGHDGHDHKSHKYNGGIVRGSVVDGITEEFKKYANISVVDGASDDVIDGGITDNEGMFLIDKIHI